MSDEIEKEVKYREIVQDEPDVRISEEPAVSGEILKVKSRFSQNNMLLDVYDKSGGVLGQAWQPVATKWKEPFTTDMSTAFMDGNDKSVARTHIQLLSQLRSYEDSHGYDMSEFANLLIDYLNGIAITSKSGGEAARTAKTMYMKSQTARDISMTPQKKEGFLDKLLPPAK